jgi:hypothetical protein
MFRAKVGAPPGLAQCKSGTTAFRARYGRADVQHTSIQARGSRGLHHCCMPVRHFSTQARLRAIYQVLQISTAWKVMYSVGPVSPDCHNWLYESMAIVPKRFEIVDNKKCVSRKLADCHSGKTPLQSWPPNVQIILQKFTLGHQVVLTTLNPLPSRSGNPDVQIILQKFSAGHKVDRLPLSNPIYPNLASLHVHIILQPSHLGHQSSYDNHFETVLFQIRLLSDIRIILPEMNVGHQVVSLPV